MAFGRLHGRQFLTATGIVDEGIDWISDEECNRAEERKRIALTFDDGPHPEYTVQLLDGLKERGVQATFFVTG
ncbi:MAG: polysaccharide deacetylase family protein, partial [Lachnospiraceae bacterium]|nr:polysaccharide deacetylase family protein [Lachnospiraceae bacterium]